MNNVTLTGRLTRDPELQYSNNGTAFSKFSIAVPRDFKRDETDFINCLAFGKTAETIAEYLSKGKRIAIVGRIQTGSYNNKEGQRVNTFEVVVDKFEFVDSAKSEENNKNVRSNVRSEEDLDDDFPFN